MDSDNDSLMDWALPVHPLHPLHPLQQLVQHRQTDRLHGRTLQGGHLVTHPVTRHWMREERRHLDVSTLDCVLTANDHPGHAAWSSA